MGTAVRRIKTFFIAFSAWIEAADDPDEPIYDPIHLGSVLVTVMVVLGALYWLLWTLLVYEGGIFMKAAAFAKVVFTSKTLADYGYRGSPYAMGVFKGWIGNLSALLLSILALCLLYRTYQDAAARSKRENPVKS